MVIVPDAEALGTITGNTYDWWAAIAFAESYTDGVNSDYRLMTRAEALAIFENDELVSALELSTIDTFWTIEDAGANEGNAFVWAGTANQIYEDSKTIENYALPVRKVNFYGLPLIESEFGGGLVYDVVAATRTVDVVANCNIFSIDAYTWENSMRTVPTEIGSEVFDSLPTRAQALKIFGNSYLVTLAGLPVDNSYWTSEDVVNGGAWYFDPSTLLPSVTYIGNLFYALPVRSEVVPES